MAHDNFGPHLAQSTELSLLEEVKHNSNNWKNAWQNLKPPIYPMCGSQLMVVGPSETLGLYDHLSLRCKRRDCPHCGPALRYKFQLAMEAAVQSHRLSVAAMLSLDRKKCPDAEKSYSYIADTWNKHRVLQRREFKGEKPISFIRVVEPQKSGHAHYHLLLDQRIDQKWLSDSWVSVGGGPIVWVNQMNENHARYMCKYLTKTLPFGYDLKIRRVSTSRDIKLFPKRGPTGFHFCNMNFSKGREILKRAIVEDIVSGNKVIGFRANRELRLD